MPTTYAHDSFGRKVYKRLPQEMQTMIHSHIQLYRIGLHGPDILFYYGYRRNFVNQKGVRLHGEMAAPFFEKGIRLSEIEKDDGLFVYLLGFACHFMLDSACHPYIYEIEGQVSHTLIEKELDRRLMIRDGLNPLHYFPARGIIPSRENAKVIGKMFPEIPNLFIEKALRGMRRLTGLMVYGNGARHRIARSFLAMLGKKEELGEFFMRKREAEGVEPYLKMLEDQYREAIPQTVEILQELQLCRTRQQPIPNRFQRNYK